MNYVLAYDESITSIHAAYEAIKLDTDVISLKSKDSNLFCGRRVDVENYPTCMGCVYNSINKYSRLTIEEHVVFRRIMDVVYDFDNAKIYDVEDVDVITRTYKIMEVHHKLTHWK